MMDFAGLLKALSEGAVKYILIGGVAAAVHGSSRLTQDVDIVYERTPDNLERLARALAPYDPYLRGAPRGLPFRWSSETLSSGLNFTLMTSLGDIDLFAEVAGGGTYQSLLRESISLRIFGLDCLCVTLPRLILLKRAAGRPRDLEAIAELEAILEETSGEH